MFLSFIRQCKPYAKYNSTIVLLILGMTACYDIEGELFTDMGMDSNNGTIDFPYSPTAGTAAKQDLNTAGTNTAGTNTAGTNTAGTNTAGTNTAGTNTAGTNTAGTNTAGTSTAGSSIDNCLPGSKIGLCEICSPDGMGTEKASYDDDCPSFDCSSKNSYRKQSVADGVECRFQSFVPGDTCQGIGACFNDIDLYCEGETEEIVMDAVETNDCIQMAGCTELIEPSIEILEGEPCDQGQGVCNADGECVSALDCNQLNISYNGKNRLCDDQDHQDPPFCEFLAHKNNSSWRSGNEEISCNDFCNQFDLVCHQVWDNDGDRCRKKDQQNCNHTMTDMICSCTLP